MRKVTPVEKKVDPRMQLMQSITLGKQALLKTTERPPRVVSTRIPEVKQNEAVAAILANRAMIAGSDSESDSDDSDSDFTDDDYG